MAKPILPSNDAYPTGQSRRVAGFANSVEKKIRKINKEFRQLVLDLPVREVNTNAKRYEFLVDTERLSRISVFLQDLIYGGMLEDPNGIWSRRWYLNKYIRGAYEQGTSTALQSAQNLATAADVGAEISQATRALSMEAIKLEPGFLLRIGLVYGRTFEAMKGLADWMKSDLSGILARGMTAGQNAKVIAKDIQSRIPVSASRARRIARTEVNNAYTSAYMAETDQLNDDVFDDGGFEMMEMHLSALTPTTRLHHASRHGQVYTTQEQREWWEKDANKINCLCSVASVLTNKKSGEVLQGNLVKITKKQGKEFFADKVGA